MKTVIAGDHIYAICPDCDKYVRLTGWFARWHLCLTPEELTAKQRYLAMIQGTSPREKF